MLQLEKYSIGVGDRFAHQAKAQLRACIDAAGRGIDVVPVWNKSFREHGIVGSRPEERARGRGPGGQGAGLERAPITWTRTTSTWTRSRVHRGQRFFHPGRRQRHRPPVPAAAIEAFLARHPELVGRIEVRRAERADPITPASVAAIAAKYLFARAAQAGRIYRHIASRKGRRAVHHRGLDGRDRQSADAARAAGDPGGASPMNASPPRPSRPSSPAASTRASITSATSGQFERGVQRRCRRDRLCGQAASALPANLKLSVHSGSDKFSIYAPSAGRSSAPAPACTSRPPAPPGWRN